MTIEWRVVIDTNVTVSAVLLPRSIPRKAFDEALAECRALLSAATMFELEEVLSRSKFQRYVTESNRLQFLAAYVRRAEMVVVEETIVECHDPKDNKFLELASCGHGTHIISGDADLLQLHP